MLERLPIVVILQLVRFIQLELAHLFNITLKKIHCPRTGFIEKQI